MRPFVSVIVPCRNEAAFIERCLESILASDYPPARMEVVVADGMSTDGTRALLARLAVRQLRLRVIDNPEGRTPVALNLAIAAARGEILVRFDGHAAMPPDYVRRCVDLLESSRADNAGGSMRTVARTGGLFAGPIVAALTSRFGVGDASYRIGDGHTGPRPADTVFGGCWRRELFSRLGGFNEQLRRGQDLEFNLRLRRAGGTIVLDPAIVCDYYARSSLASFWKHNFSNGVWAVLPFAWTDSIPVRARHLVPLVFVAALASFCALPFPWPIILPTIYTCASLGASARIALDRRSLSCLALVPVAFATLHLSYGLGSAWGCLLLAGHKLSPLMKGAHAGGEIKT